MTAGGGARPRWAHLRGNNPWVLAREQADAAAVQSAGRDHITGELPVLVLPEPEPVAAPPADETNVATEGAVAGPASTGSLVRSSAVVGVGTLLSRVTGLARTVALAYALGRTVVADGYNLANTTPNIVYDLILGGILSATLVPVFVDRFDHDDEDGIDAVVTLVVATLVALTVAAVVAAPLLFRAYTWAATGDRASLEQVGVPLLRLLLPQILFYGLTALATAMLNARRSFAAPAFAPVLNNVLVCGVLVVFAQRVGGDPDAASVAGDRGLLWLLGGGTTLGIVLMTVVLWPALRKANLRWRWRFEPRNPAVREVLSLSGWTLGYVVANQVSLAVVLALAGKETGAVTAYTYAFQFFQLPYGLFVVSIMTTFTPELASAAARDDLRSMADRLGSGLRLMAVVVVPSAVGMAALALPIVRGVLGYGSFAGSSPTLTGEMLLGFAPGLIGFCAYLFALRGFYALHDTRTPFLLNLAENAINIVLAALFIRWWGPSGLAWAYSAAYLLAAVVTLSVLRRRVGSFGGSVLLRTLVRVTIASMVMAGVVVAVQQVTGIGAGVGALLRAAAGALVGIVTFAVVASAMRVEEVRAVRTRLLRR